MSEEAYQALLGAGENLSPGDLTGVPEVSGEQVLKQLSPEAEKPEEESVEEQPEEKQPEEAGSFLDTLGAVDIGSDDAYALKVPMQDAEGNKIYKTIGELKDEYKQSVEFNQQVQQTQTELAARQTELESKETQFRVTQSDMLQMPQELFEVNARITSSEQHIMANQDEMMKSNPGGLALMRQEVQSLQYQRDNLQQQILNQRESVQQALRDEQMIQQQRTMENLGKQMLTLIPEWQDSTVKEAESKALIDYGISKGFSQQQMMTINDPQTVKFLREQMIRDNSLAAVKPKDDMLTPLKPQVVKDKSTAERAAYNKLIKKATNSKDSREKIDGIVALMSQ